MADTALVAILNSAQYAAYRPYRSPDHLLLTAEPIREVLGSTRELCGSSLIEPNEAQSIYEGLGNLTRKWRTLFESPLRYRGIDLLDTFQNDLWYFFLYAQFAELVLNRAIEQGRPNRLLLFRSQKVAQLWDPTEGPSPDIFSAVAQWEAEKKGLPIEWLALPPTVEPSNSPSVEPSLESAPSGHAPRALVWLHGFSAQSRIRPFFERLQKTHDCVPVRIYETADFPFGTISLPQWVNRAQRRQSHAVRIHRAKIHFQKMRACQSEGVFKNPYLDFQWQTQLDRLLDAGPALDAYLRLFDTVQPDLTLTEWDSDGFGQLRIAAAKKAGIQTVGISHGSLGPLFFQIDCNALPTDRFLAEGPYYETAFRTFLPKSTQVQSIGAFVPQRPPSHGQKVTFLTTGFNYGLCAPTGDLKKYELLWRKLRNWMAAMPTLEFQIQPHPRYDYGELFESLELPKNCRVLQGQRIEGVLSDSRCAVLVDTTTSAALEAIQAQVPFLYLRCGMYGVPILKSALDVPASWNTDQFSEFERLFPAVYQNSAYRKEVVVEQRLWFERQFPHGQLEEALQTFEEAIALGFSPWRSMLLRAHRALARLSPK